jgi:hypothetical protein
MSTLASVRPAYSYLSLRWPFNAPHQNSRQRNRRQLEFGFVSVKSDSSGSCDTVTLSHRERNATIGGTFSAYAFFQSSLLWSKLGGCIPSPSAVWRTAFCGLRPRSLPIIHRPPRRPVARRYRGRRPRPAVAVRLGRSLRARTQTAILDTTSSSFRNP